MFWRIAAFISGTRIGPRKKNFQMDLATVSLIGQVKSMVVRTEGTTPGLCQYSGYYSITKALQEHLALA